MDINNLTIVQSLAFNTVLWKSRELGMTHKLDLLGDIYELHDKGFDEALEVDGYREILSKYAKYCHKLGDNESWIMRTAHNNLCRKLAWPSVKLPGYSKEHAIAEFREVIEFVRRRYENN